jgi:hypothetical protein
MIFVHNKSTVFDKYKKFFDSFAPHTTNRCRRKMTGYLFECIYRLLIPLTDNVSKSLGFEGVGLFNC